MREKKGINNTERKKASILFFGNSDAALRILNILEPRENMRIYLCEFAPLVHIWNVFFVWHNWITIATITTYFYYFINSLNSDIYCPIFYTFYSVLSVSLVCRCVFLFLVCMFMNPKWLSGEKIFLLNEEKLQRGIKLEKTSLFPVVIQNYWFRTKWTNKMNRRIKKYSRKFISQRKKIELWILIYFFVALRFFFHCRWFAI